MNWVETYDTAGEVIFEVDADIYLNDDLTRNEAAAYQEVAEKIGGTLQDPVLDLACGPGRHSAFLAKTGHKVVGLDYSHSFLRIAATRACATSFINGDGRSLPFREASFGSVLIFGNSFGYFSDEENEQVIREAARLLTHNGLFVFDIADRGKFLANLKPYSRTLVETPTFGDVVDERWRSWRARDGRVHARKRHANPAGILLDTEYAIRLYEPDEIATLVERYFSTVRVSPMSGLDDAQFGLMNNRIIIAAKK